MALVSGLLVLLVSAAQAQAHAEFVSAEPAPGALLTHSPAAIWLEFSEGLRPGTTVMVYGTGFRVLSGVVSTIDLTKPTRLYVELPPLVTDNYTVQWTSVSEDGDMLTGSYSFGVRPATTAPMQWFVALPVGLIALAVLAIVIYRRVVSSRPEAPIS